MNVPDDAKPSDDVIRHLVEWADGPPDVRVMLLTSTRAIPHASIDAWTHAHTNLVWCIARRARVVACWLAFSAVVIIVDRLLRQAWTRDRWDGRPPRKP